MDEASTSIRTRQTERRAVEAVTWGIPVVNFHRMLQAATDAGLEANQILFWSTLCDWHNQTLTPNPDSVYFMPFFDTREAGPIVIEIPPATGGSITGSIMDCWQNALEDAGPSGADTGEGGRYLILPPDYQDPLPDGYIPLASDTFQGYALLRSILDNNSDADIARAVAYARQIKLYPLSQADNPPETVFRDAGDTVIDATIPYDLRFFEALHQMVQREPWLMRDKAMIDPLKTIGITKGEPFAPDDATVELLIGAAKEGRAVLDLNYRAAFEPAFFPGTHWALPVSPELVEGMPAMFSVPDRYPIDSRGVAYSIAFFSSKHLGTGSYYLLSIVDAGGNDLDGANTYQLTVPADAPVQQYWSATVYNRETHSLIRAQSRASRSSLNQELHWNEDGSADIYFGPSAPSGKESNWVPTDPGGAFEILFRFYGPTKALFEKKWALPDPVMTGR